MKNKIFLCALCGFQWIKAQEIILPFSLYEDKHILLKLPTENAVDSLTFYFDTGAATTLLDKNAAEKRGIKANYQHEVTGASGKKTYDMVVNQKVRLTSTQVVEGVNIVLDDLSRIKQALSENFDGIIGNDIIKNFITKINFHKKQMELYKFDAKISTEGYTEIPFVFKNNIPIPQFPISITLNNGEKLTGDIFFDSGAGLSLLINTPFKEENQLMSKIGKHINTVTHNLSQKTEVSTAIIKSLTISNFTFKNLPIKMASDKEGVSAYKGYLGILGAEIINKFDIILNYSTSKLYLKPNYLYAKKIEFPVSPFQLARTEKGIVIAGVVKDSEADKKGLKEGQKIVSINKIATEDIQIYRNLLKQENTEVTIQYLDNTILKTVKLKLKKLL